METGAVPTRPPGSGLGTSRRNVLRGVAGAGAALAVAGAAGCSRISLAAQKNGGDLLQRLRDAGEVHVGFANEAPYSYLNKDAKLTGEAAVIAKVIFKRLGVPTLVPTPSDFGSLIPGLRSNLFDVIGAGMSITPARCKEVAFTNPDFNAPSAFLVKKGNPKNIQTFQSVADNKNVRLGVLLGAVEGDVAKEFGVPGSRITNFADQPSGYQAVLIGRVDALALTTISLRWALKQHPHDPLEVTAPFYPEINGVRTNSAAGGFAFSPDQTNIVAAFNRELDVLRRSGELLALQRPFGFTEAEQTDLTAQQLCNPPSPAGSPT